MCTVFISPGALRVNIAGKVAVVAGIRIDDAADGAVLRSDLRFNASERVAVTHDNDLAAHIDPAARQFLIILLRAVVGVDELSDDVAIHGICVVHRQLFGLLSRSGIFLQSGLFQFCSELLRRGHFQKPGLWRWEENVERFNLGVKTPRAE